MISLKFIRIITCILIISGLFGNSYCSIGADSIIIKAMKDEMNRNLNDLKYEDHPEPFFISYNIYDIESLTIQASFGAITNSFKNHNRSWSARVIVGDYKVNDENYVGSYSSTDNEMGNQKLPLENDYYGIRRTLWITTNNIYKRAAKKYKDKVEVLKENKIHDSVLIDDFSKEEAVQIYIEPKPININKEYYENLARQYSIAASKYGKIYSSDAVISIINAIIYMVNSEGTEVKIPANLFNLNIAISIMCDDGEVLSSNISYFSTNNEDIPFKDSVISDVELLVNDLEKQNEARYFNGIYTGPVLITGQIVPEVLIDNLFRGNNSLISTRELLYSSADKSMRYGNSENDIEKKFGKKVTPVDLTIRSYSSMNEYGPIPLHGSFFVDGEGVKPPNVITLVEHGKLINLLNSRTPTKNIKKSNGHMRYGLNYNSVARAMCPGIVKVETKQVRPYNELKQLLIDQAKNEMYEYAFIVKPLKNSYNAIYPGNYYLINVNTGEEKLIRAVDAIDLSNMFLRKLVAFSDNTIAVNYLFTEYNSGTDIPVSFISPDAMLLKNVTIEGYNESIINTLPKLSPPDLNE